MVIMEDVVCAAIDLVYTYWIYILCKLSSIVLKLRKMYFHTLMVMHTPLIEIKNLIIKGH